MASIFVFFSTNNNGNNQRVNAAAAPAVNAPLPIPGIPPERNNHGIFEEPSEGADEPRNRRVADRRHRAPQAGLAIDDMAVDSNEDSSSFEDMVLDLGAREGAVLNADVMETSLEDLRRRLQAAVLSSYRSPPPPLPALLLPKHALPPDLHTWSEHARVHPRGAWKHLRTLIEQYTRELIPRDCAQHFMHLHEMATLVRLISVTGQVAPPSTLTRALLQAFGGRLWDVFTGESYSDPQFPRVDWWRLISQLRFAIVSMNPAHQTFREWYASKRIAELLDQEHNDTASRYLMWAHKAGFCACQQDTSQTGFIPQLDDWLPILSDLCSANNARASPAMFYSEDAAADVLAPAWQTKPVSQLRISQLWRVLAMLHERWHHLMWTPGVELLILLLWHHMQRLVIGGPEVDPSLYDDRVFLEDNPNDANGAAAATVRARKPSLLFSQQCETIFTRHLEVIRSFYIHASKAPSRCVESIPIGFHDAYEPATPNCGFRPSAAERHNIERLLRAVYSQEVDVVAGVDTLVACQQYRAAHIIAALIPGEMRNILRVLGLVRPSPAMIIYKSRQGDLGPLAELTMAHDAPHFVVACLNGEAASSVKVDMVPFAGLACTVMLRCFIQTTIFSRPRSEDEESALASEAALRRLQSRLSDSKVPLIELSNSNRTVLDLMDVDPPSSHNNAEPARFCKRKRDEIETHCSKKPEFRPDLNTWFVVATDTENDLPFANKRSLSWSNSEQTGNLPRLVAIRGEYWVVHRNDDFFLRTRDVFEALCGWICRVAYEYPTYYEKHAEPLLVQWFQRTASFYAKAGSVTMMTNDAAVATTKKRH